MRRCCRSVVLSPFLTLPAHAITLLPDDVLVSAAFVSRVPQGGGTEVVVPSSPGIFPTELAADANGAVYVTGQSASGNAIYRVDAASMTAPLLVNLPTLIAEGTQVDLAADPLGGLHLITGDDSLQRLYAIDPISKSITLTFENGASTGPLPGSRISGISFLDADTAVLAVKGTGGFGTGGIYTYELGSGTTTLLASGGFLIGNPAADNFLSPNQVFVRNGTIFVGSAGSCGFINPCWQVVGVDPVTSAQVLLGGAIGTLSDLDASLAGDKVYATATPTTNFSPGRLYAINVAAPGASQVANVSLPDIAPAVAVVPEPATGALVALGLVILASRRRAIR